MKKTAFKRILSKKNSTKKIRKGDRVVAIAGNYKGQVGEVLQCRGDRVVVQGLNMRKKHMKRGEHHQQGFVEVERSIHVSNCKVCPDGEQGVRLKVKISAEGDRELCYGKGEEQVPYRKIKNSGKQ